MPATTAGMDWNDQAISTLRALWAEGHSTAEIGRRMGVTKNAIVGKAHRLALPARRSPIRDATPGRPKPIRRVRSTVSTLASLLPARPAAPPPSARVPPAAPTAPRSPEPSPARPVLRRSRELSRGCQWPTGTPGTSNFLLCGDEPAPGKPYCTSHCGRAYVRPRAGDAAAVAA